MKPLLVDLFCGEGGAAEGYRRAGFRVIGVDLGNHRRRFQSGAFIQADVFEEASVEALVRLADAVHASPPCQFGSELTPAGARDRHLNLIPPTRSMCERSGKPYIIENVRAVRDHLVNPVSLFGTMFGNGMVTEGQQAFVLSRERLFETNWGLTAPHDPGTRGWPIANVYGGHLRARSGEFRTGKGTGRTVDFPGEDRAALARQLMGMPWATMNGMSEAVPPSYAEYIGRQLMAHLTTAPDAPAVYKG